MERQNLTGQSFGSYQIEALWDRRGSCNLYTARDLREDNLVLLAILDSSKDEEPEACRRFQRRMETVAQLVQPGIAPILDIGLTPANQPYAAMRFYPGVSLAEYRSTSAGDGQTMPAVEALLLIRGIADALRVAHPAGLIHSDLRPENVLVREDSSPLLVDLGITGRTQSSAAMVDMLRSGVLDYASPEQLEGKILSGQSNIYSLGIILYELLSGQRPHIPSSSWDIFDQARIEMPQGVPLEEVNPDLTARTYRLVRHCLWREEWNRFETVNRMIEAIDKALAAERRKAAQATSSGGRHWLYVTLPLLALLAAVALFLLLR